MNTMRKFIPCNLGQRLEGRLYDVSKGHARRQGKDFQSL